MAPKPIFIVNNKHQALPPPDLAIAVGVVRVERWGDGEYGKIGRWGGGAVSVVGIFASCLLPLAFP